jgi:hypothetical protein
MIHGYALVVVTAVAFLLALQPDALAENAPETPAKPLPLVSPIFGDNMVLQRRACMWMVSPSGAGRNLATRSELRLRAKMHPRLRE